MESLSQGDSSSNSSAPDDELGPAYVNDSGLARILERNEQPFRREGLPTIQPQAHRRPVNSTSGNALSPCQIRRVFVRLLVRLGEAIDCGKNRELA
jgi:hypothetical protein